MNFRGASTPQNFKYGRSILVNNILDIPGLTGPSGLVGPTGPYGGPVGVQGYQGYQGYQGWQGWQGFRGNQGIPGPLGPLGPIGPVGPIGARGLQGFGFQGFAGTQGYQGSAFELLTYGTNRILISTGAYNAIGYSNFVYDGNTLSAPNIYTSTQHLGNPLDTVSSPAYSWDGDITTGFYHPSTGSIAITTTSIERLRISTGGNIGIGTTNPITLLDVSGTIRAPYFTGTNAGFNNLTSSNIISSYFTGSNAGFNNLTSSSYIISPYFTGANAGFNNLTSTNIISSYFTGANAGFNNLTSSSYIISPYFTGANAGFNNLTSTNITTTNVNTTNITTTNVTASNTISSLSFTGSNAVFNNLTSTNIIISPYYTGGNAGFNNLTSSNIISSSYFTGTNAGITTIRAGNIIISPYYTGTNAGITSLNTVNSTVSSNLTVAGQILATGGNISNPSYSFNGNTNLGIYSPSSNTLGFVSNGNERLRINSTGYVGIGTTSPSTQLHISSSLNSSVNQLVRFATPNLSSSSPIVYKLGFGCDPFGISDVSSAIGFIRKNASANNASAIAFYTYNGASTGNDLTSEVMRVDSNGNVGIGTTGPESALHVVGTRVNTPSIKGIHMGELANDYAIEICCNSSSNSSFIDFNYPGVDYRGRILYNMPSNYMSFSTSAIERMRIDSAGNVGIGTSNPQYNLHVMGFGVFQSTPSAPTPSISLLNTGGAGWIFSAPRNDGSNRMAIFWNTGSSFSENMSILPNGNVGIGTSSPGFTLDVNGVSTIRNNLNVNYAGSATTPMIKVSPTTNGNESSIGFYTNTSNGGGVWIAGHNLSSAGADKFSIYNSIVGGNVMTLTSTSGGFAGIGTTSPPSKFYVSAGNIGFSYGRSIVVGGDVVAGQTTTLINVDFAKNGLPGDTVSMYTPGANSSAVRIAYDSSGRIYLNGSIGVGTSNPQYKADINGELRVGYSGVRSYLFNLGCTGDGGGPRASYIYGDESGNMNIVNQQAGCYMLFGTNNLERMRIDSAGNVGIGMTPSYLLDVGGQMRATVYNTSDTRIKTNIKPVDINTCLEMVNKFQVVQYDYKNQYVNQGTGIVGFIAQQCAQVDPNCVLKKPDYIPNVNQTITCYPSTQTGTYYFTLSDPSLLSSGDDVMFINSNQRIYSIVNKDINNVFTFKGDNVPSILFCYGKKVDDFYSLDKNRLFAYGIGAIQDLTGIVTEQQTQIQTQQQQIQQLSSQLESLTNTISQLIMLNNLKQ